MKRAVVMGLGASGRAAARLLLRVGGFEVVGVDLRTDLLPEEGVCLELGPHRRETFVQADLIVMSPGIPPDQADARAAREAGVEVLGEVALCARYALKPDVPVVAISGTNGKSTVTHLVGQLCEAGGLDPFVGGNIGNSASNADLGDHRAVVLELSSYQLEAAGALKPRVGLLLNLTPDHLARHGDMPGYADAKCRIFENMDDSDLAVLPTADAYLTEQRAGDRGRRAWLGALPGVVRDGIDIRVEIPGCVERFDASDFALPGEHNLDNLAAALLAVCAIGVPADVLQRAIPTLTGLPHRMEPVPTTDGRFWIDDSKSTNVDSTLAALRGRKDPTVLLLGGKWKGPGYGALAASMDAVHTVICFGADGMAIALELRARGLDVTCASTMARAVFQAHLAARTGDTILLSPACASFDEFDNFEHRGRVFADLVRSSHGA